MKKKNGFTLAEVLITLAIIGVVATLTLPALMTNTAEQQAVTGYRKAMNTLNEVGQMSAAVDGFDYSSISNTDAPGTATVTDANGVSLPGVWAILANRAQVDKSMSGTSKITSGGCQTYTAQVFFLDGTVLCYNSTKTTSGPNDVIEGYIDTNGVKGPNKKFECDSNACKPSERSIGDQFPVTLRGGNAYPGKLTTKDDKGQIVGDKENYAASWAMRK